MRSARLGLTLLAPSIVAGLAVASSGIAAQSTPGSGSLANVESLIEGGRYGEAEALAQQVFSDASARGEDWPTGSVLVRTLVLNGRGAQPNARDIASRLVRDRRASGTPSELATALRGLGSVLYKAGDYGDAVAALKEAVSIRERLGNPSPDLGEDLQQLVEALSDVLAASTVAGEAASPLADRLVDMRRASGERVPLARALRARGVLRQNAGDYTRARADLQESVSILEAALPIHPETALALAHAGEQLQFEGALAQADQTLSRACAMADSTLRPDHPDVAECLRLRAQVREELGDFGGARVLRERGLAIAKASLGETHPRLAVQMNDLAINYQSQNDLATARSLLEQSRRVYTAKLGAMSNGTIVSSYNIALLDTQMGDYQEARREFERVIAAWTKTLGPRHPNVARALSAQAYVLAEQNLDLEARRLYERALRIREQAYGADHLYVGRALSNVAASYDKLGEHQRALELSQRALRIVEKSGAPDDLAEALMTNAEILSRSGNQEGAAESHRRALAIRVELFGASHPIVATSQVALAAAEARLGLSSQAFERALVGQRIGREHALLVLRSLPERQALEYANTRPRGLDLAISLAQTGDDRISALNELVLNRSLTLDEMSARRRIAADADRSETRAVWDELASARQRLANLIVRGPRGNKDDYTRLLDEARGQKESLERTLAERSGAFRESERRATVGLAEVSRALPPGSALVSFVRYERTMVKATPAAMAGSVVPSYAAFVLRSAEDPPVLIHLGTAAGIESAVVRWREELLAGATVDRSALASAERTLRTSGAQLRARLWDPIASHLTGVSRVFVVPDGALNRVPIAALPAKSGGYLVEGAYVVHYLSAERDVVANHAPGVVPSRGLLALGGPTYDGSATAQRGVPPAASAGERTQSITTRSVTSADAASGSSPCLVYQKLRFPTLPATRREAEEVAALWDAHQPGGVSDSMTLFGADATETTFKQLAPRQAVLHLATHGFFLGDNCDAVASVPGARAVGGIIESSSTGKRASAKRPAAMLDSPLVLSGLALAGANRRASTSSTEDDGILTAEEVASLDLVGVQWAVLSACDTGLGLIRGSEGVLGLPRAFQTAGARTVIMSLWPAADRATRSWMLALYRARLEKGQDTADAVHDAALTALRARRSSGLSGHPFFWAGFIATGDWH